MVDPTNSPLYLNLNSVCLYNTFCDKSKHLKMDELDIPLKLEDFSPSFRSEGFLEMFSYRSLEIRYPPNEILKAVLKGVPQGGLTTRS
jgi:hypothetical protein